MALLDGKVCIVTGAGHGIGRAHALELARHGASVVVNDLGTSVTGDGADQKAADLTVELIAQRGGTAVASYDDVADYDAAGRLVQQAVDAFGRLDVLVNNAGLGGTAPLVEMTDDEWHRVLDVTLTGTMRVTRAALRHLVAAGRGGAIVNNASVLGWRAQAGQAHYAAAKAGVMALTRCAAVEAAPHGVRVNAVAPSLAMHPFLSKVMDQATLDQLAQQEAFGRAAEPWEVATVIAFLASDLSGYMTGEVVSVSSQHP